MKEYFRDHPEELPKPPAAPPSPFCDKPIGFHGCTFTNNTLDGTFQMPFLGGGIMGTPEGTFDLNGNPIDLESDDDADWWKKSS